MAEANDQIELPSTFVEQQQPLIPDLELPINNPVANDPVIVEPVENFESSLKKPRTDAEMEAVVEPPVVPLRRICPLVLVEQNYAGGQKNGSVKGEVEWAVWDSDGVIKDERGCFLYDYSEHHEEHALVMEGNATLVPRIGLDSFDPIEVGPGDYLIFKKGLFCEWKIHSRIRKRYCFFDDKGDPIVAGEKISCDLCGRDCTDESAGVRKPEADEDEIEDLCLACYRENKANYSSEGEHLVNGVVVGDLNSIPGDAKRKLDDIY